MSDKILGALAVTLVHQRRNTYRTNRTTRSIPNMKIIRLSAENVKRLVAVEIHPKGSVVTIGGKNGAGKSSVLDSIAYALGGVSLVPAEPIRKGQTEAKITVDLGDLVVTRKFTREILDGGQGDPKVWGDTKSTLTVTNKEGAKYPSPQAMLDKLLGQLTFDPLEFAKSKGQAEILRRLVKLDFTELNGRRKTAYDQRAMSRKTFEIRKAQLSTMAQYKDAPTQEIPLTEISQEMMRAEHARKAADEAERAMLKAEQDLSHYESGVTAKQRHIEDLEAQLRTEHEALTTMRGVVKGQTLQVESLRKIARERHALIPDVEVIKAKVSEIEETNQKVRFNQKYDAAAKELDGIALQIKGFDGTINAVDTEKEAQLQAAKFPVVGLGLDDVGVIFNGIPFEQASTSEQLRVSVAIGLALNPSLKVLLIRNGNSLDDDSMVLVAKMAADADAQVWMEYVTGSPAGMSVMMEDGGMVVEV